MSPSQFKPAQGRPTPFANRVAARRARAPAAGDATPTWSWPTRPGYLPRPPRSRRTIRTLGAAHRRLPHLTAVADMPEARIVVYTPMDDETRERLPLTRRLTAG
jgi:hypothetical protein